MSKVLCVLFDDPVTGYPTTYARDDFAQPERYPDGQTLPTPKGIDFKPGLDGNIEIVLGKCRSRSVGRRRFLSKFPTSAVMPDASM